MATLKLEQNRRTIMAIPSYLIAGKENALTYDDKAKGYATATGSKLIITSMLFDKHQLEFLAFLTDMSQTFASTWNSENVFGRNDPIGIFQGTVRTISLAFNVVAGDVREAKLNTEKLSVLASFLYPSYKSVKAIAIDQADMEVPSATGTSYMYGSPLVRVKFANLIDNNEAGGGDGLLGWIGSLSVTPVMDNGTFIEGTNHYPKTFDVSFDFNVLHERTPGYDEKGQYQPEQYFFGTGRPIVNTPAEKAQYAAEDAENDEYNSSPNEPTPEEAAAEWDKFVNDPFGVADKTSEQEE